MVDFKRELHGLVFGVSSGNHFTCSLEHAVAAQGSPYDRHVKTIREDWNVAVFEQRKTAAGAKIVVEAKESAAYDLAKSLAEADVARRNRGAGVCVFVHSAKTAQPGVPEFARYGPDILVRWDADEPNTDLWLKAALMVAKMMSVRAAQHDKSEAASYLVVDRAIEAIRKQVSGFDEIVTAANTSRNASKRIIERATLMKAEIEVKINALGQEIEKIKEI